MVYRTSESENELQGKWYWHLDRIKAVRVFDNVVAQTIDKLKKLPTATQHILQIAACLGGEFDLETLAAIESEQFR